MTPLANLQLSAYDRISGTHRIDEYLQDRYLGRGWSVRRLCAELGVGHGWLDQQLTRLGLRS